MAGAIKGITVEIGGDTTKLGKALADVNKKSKDLQNELKGVNTLLKMDPGNVTLLTQKQDLLKESIAATSEKLEKLKSAQAQVQQQFDKGEITAEQFRDFQREIVATEQKLESLTDQMKEFGSVAAQEIAAAGQKISEVGDNVSGAGEKLLPVTAAVGAAGTAVVMSADDLKSAANSYLAATGTAAEGTETLADGTVVVTDNMETFKGVIEDIYANNYGESFEDIANSMSKVKNNLGEIDGAQLQAATESALALRDVFEFDVNESTRSAKMLMDQYGMSADDAFNLIAQGAQNGLDKNGDLLDTINEYAVHFEGLGLGAEEMFNMLVNGADNGTFSVDKLGDAVKEFGIRAKDGSDSTADAFAALGLDADATAKKFAQGGEGAKAALDEVTKALFAMDDPLAQNQVGVALFGTMWEDLGAEGVKSLMDLNGEISTTNAAMDELKEQKYDDLKSQLSELGRTIVTNVAIPLGETLLPIISSVVGKISEWITKFGELSPVARTIILVVAGIAAAIGPVLIVIGKLLTAVGTIMTWAPKIVSGVKLIGTGLKALFGLIAAHPVIAIVTAVIAAVVLLYNKCEWFRNGVNAIFSAIGQFVQSAFEGIVTFFTTTLPNAISAVVTYFSELPGKISTAISSLVSTVTNVFTNVKNAIFSVAENIYSSLPSGFQLVVQNVRTIISNFVNIFRNYFNIIKTVVQTAISVIKAIFSGDFASIPDIVSGALEKIKGFIANILDSAVTIVVNWIATVINYFRGLVQTWVQIFNNLKTTLTKWWSNLKTTFTTWVKNIVNSTVNFFKELPGKIYNAIVNAISRVKTWGSNLLNTARTAASNMVNGVVSFVSQLPGRIYSAISGAISRVRSWGSSIASAAGSAISNMVSRVVSIASSLPGKFLSIGRNIIEGIKNGISGAISGLYNTIKSGLSGLVDKAKAALGIRSPSRVFRDTIGAMIPSGIAVGIQKNEGVATDAVEEMADDLAAQEFSVNGATINRKLNTTFGTDSAATTATNALDPANLMGLLGEIRDKLSRLQVVLDSGELVGGIIDPIDTALNDKYNKVARGW